MSATQYPERQNHPTLSPSEIVTFKKLPQYKILELLQEVLLKSIFTNKYNNIKQVLPLSGMTSK